MKKLLHIGIVLGLLLAFLSGCGGGVETLPTTVTLESEPDMDGGLSSIGGIIGVPSIKIGDLSDNTRLKGILSFLISSIPSGATVQTATLRIYQANGNIGDSYNLGAVGVDHITFTTYEAAIYDLIPLEYVGGTLATSFAEGWKEIDVTEALKNDISSSRTRSQYRFYHLAETDGDNTQDTDTWFVGEHATLKPQLVVTYTL